jgi:hypothetical protein
MTSAASYRYPAIQGDDDLGSEFEVEAEAEEEYEEELESELTGHAEAEEEYELEDEFEEEQFDGLSRALGGYLARGSEGEEEAEFDFEAEAEAAYEAEEEAEGFVNPVRRIYRDAELMAHLSSRAAQADSEAEAEAFLGALVPIAARLIPRATQLLVRNAPTLIRGVSRLGQQLRRDPATRRFITAIPVILQRTAQSLADQAAAGRPISADTVIQTLTSVAARILGRPANRQRAVQAVGVFDRGYHNRWRTVPAGRRGAARPRRRPASPAARRRDKRRR